MSIFFFNAEVYLGRPKLPSIQRPFDRLSVLDGRRFSAAHVKKAAKIDQHALTNLISKSGLDLCSESTGQGRPRKFALVDVYQLVLMTRLVGLTGRVTWSADWLNEIMWQDQIPQLSEMNRRPSMKGRRWMYISSEFSDNEIKKIKILRCENIKNCREIYSHRDITDPIYIFSDSFGNELNFGNPFKDGFFPGGIVVNVTLELTGADKYLTTLIRDVERE